MGWANETRVYPDSVVTGKVIGEMLSFLADDSVYVNEADTAVVSRQTACRILWKVLGSPTVSDTSDGYQDVARGTELDVCLAYWQSKGATAHWAESKRFDPEAPMRRKEMAYVINQVVDLFDRFPLILNSFQK